MKRMTLQLLFNYDAGSVLYASFLLKYQRTKTTKKASGRFHSVPSNIIIEKIIVTTIPIKLMPTSINLFRHRFLEEQPVGSHNPVICPPAATIKIAIKDSLSQIALNCVAIANTIIDNA